MTMIQTAEVREWTWYIPQNTGWSGGSSWFPTFAATCDTLAEAVKLNKQAKKSYGISDTKYRVIKQTIREEVVCAS